MTTPDLLYPYVVPASWTAHVGPENVLAWATGSDVHVVLVFDGQGSVRNVRPQDLEALQLDKAQAFDAANQNLARAWQREAFSFGFAELKDGTVIAGARGNWMAPAAALVLGDFHTALSQRFGNTPIAAVAVNQECLFAFPTDERTLASQSLRLAIDDEFTGHPKPISRQWLLLDGKWPRAYPGEQLF